MGAYFRFFGSRHPKRDVSIAHRSKLASGSLLPLRLKEYAAQDDRIVLINKKNAGYGAAMNDGLDAARGEYIGILESDDYVCPDAWSFLYNEASSDDLDVAKGCYWRLKDEQDSFFEVCRKVDPQCPDSLLEPPYDTLLTPSDYPRCFWMNPSIWSCLYRRSFLIKNSIRFNETPGASYQDTSFAFKVLVSAVRMKLFKYPIIHYRTDNEASSSNSRTKVYAVCDEMTECKNYLDQRNAPRLFYNVLTAIRYKTYLWNLERISPNFKCEFTETVVQDLSNDYQSGFYQPEFFTQHGKKDFLSYVGETELSSRKAREDAFTVLVKSEQPEPAISVIIPFYNQEKYLSECIESVLGQSLEDYEIILVDDGSIDTSLKLALRYAESDKRITLITKQNSGQSDARNVGLDVASGKYICFLDSDDLIDAQAFEALLSKAESSKLDILLFDARSIYENEMLRKQYPGYQNSYKRKREYGAVRSGADLFSEMEVNRDYQVSPCLAFISKRMIDDNNLRFESGIIHEDNLWTFQLMLKARRASHTRQELYIRRVRAGSTMTSPNNLKSIAGYVRCATTIQEIASSERLSFAVRSSAQAQCAIIRRQVLQRFNSLSQVEKSSLHSFLSPKENALLDSILWALPSLDESRRLRKQLSQTKESFERMQNSHAAKIGRMITGVPKRMKKLLKGSSSLESRDNQKGKRVLFIAGDCRHSGASMSLLAMIKKLRAKGEDVHLILPSRGPVVEMAKRDSIPYVVIESWQWAISTEASPEEQIQHQTKREAINKKAVEAIKDYAVKNGIELIHTNTIGTYVGAEAARQLGIPSVWHIREFMEEDHGVRFWNREEALGLISHSEKCICISQSVVEKFAPMLGEDKCALVYNGIDENKYYRSRKKSIEGAIELTVCANFEPGKGQMEAINALDVIVNEFKIQNVHLNLIGQHFKEDYVCEIEKLIKQKALEGFVYMPGVRNDMPEFWAHTDIALVPSRCEAFGRCTVEAMLAGTIVVGANTAGTKELISDGVTGFLYEQGNPHELAKTIKKIIDNPSNSSSIARVAQQFARKEYTCEKNAQKVYEIHRQILSE